MFVLLQVSLLRYRGPGLLVDPRQQDQRGGSLSEARLSVIRKYNTTTVVLVVYNQYIGLICRNGVHSDEKAFIAETARVILKVRCVDVRCKM